MSTLALSEDALALLRLHHDGGSLVMGVHDPESLPGRSVEETRAAYRELVEAGLMMVLHTFAHGRESAYRYTEEGWDRRYEWLNVPSIPAPSPVESPSLRG